MLPPNFCAGANHPLPQCEVAASRRRQWRWCQLHEKEAALLMEGCPLQLLSSATVTEATRDEYVQRRNARAEFVSVLGQRRRKRELTASALLALCSSLLLLRWVAVDVCARDSVTSLTGGTDGSQGYTAGFDLYDIANELEGTLEQLKGQPPSSSGDVLDAAEQPARRLERYASSTGSEGGQSLEPVQMIEAMLRDAQDDIQKKQQYFKREGEKLLLRRAAAAGQDMIADDVDVVTEPEPGIREAEQFGVDSQTGTAGQSRFHVDEEDERELEQAQERHALDIIELNAIDKNMQFCARLKKSVEEHRKTNKIVRPPGKLRRLMNRIKQQLGKAKSGAVYLKSKVASAMRRWGAMPGIRGKIYRVLSKVGGATARFVKRGVKKAIEIIVKYMPIISVVLQVGLIVVAAASNPVGLAIVSLVFAVGTLIYNIIQQGTNAMYNLKAQRYFKSMSQEETAHAFMGLTWARVASADEDGDSLLGGFKKSINDFADPGSTYKEQVKEMWKERRFKTALKIVGFTAKKGFKIIYRLFVIFLSKMGALASLFMNRILAPIIRKIRTLRVIKKATASFRRASVLLRWIFVRFQFFFDVVDPFRSLAIFLAQHWPKIAAAGVSGFMGNMYLFGLLLLYLVKPIWTIYQAKQKFNAEKEDLRAIRELKVGEKAEEDWNNFLVGRLAVGQQSFPHDLLGDHNALRLIEALIHLDKWGIADTENKLEGADLLVKYQLLVQQEFVRAHWKCMNEEQKKNFGDAFTKVPPWMARVEAVDATQSELMSQVTEGAKMCIIVHYKDDFKRELKAQLKQAYRMQTATMSLAGKARHWFQRPSASAIARELGLLALRYEEMSRDHTSRFCLLVEAVRERTSALKKDQQREVLARATIAFSKVYKRVLFEKYQFSLGLDLPGHTTSMSENTAVPMGAEENRILEDGRRALEEDVPDGARQDLDRAGKTFSKTVRSAFGRVIALIRFGRRVAPAPSVEERSEPSTAAGASEPSTAAGASEPSTAAGASEPSAAHRTSEH